MKIIDAIKSKHSHNKPVISVEFMPPRNGESLEQIYNCISVLKKHDIDFTTVTNGSGGSSRAGTAAIARLLQEKLGKPSAAHITCLKRTQEGIENELIEYSYLGLQNVIALRGDPAFGELDFYKSQHAYAYASGLVRQIQDLKEGRYIKRGMHKDAKNFHEGQKLDFCIGVAGYPEKHPECDSLKKDIENLKRKISLGAEFIITQLVFDSNTFLDFMRKCKDSGIESPLLCGLMPITNPDMLKKTEKVFHAKMFDSYSSFYSGCESEKDYQEAALKAASSMIKKLVQSRVDGIHIYALNRSQLLDVLLSKIKEI